jgi:hypothetical protein
MFGATVLAPLLMGFDPNLAILMSGVGTLLFFLLVGGRVPSYLGSSFSFIGLVIAVTGYAGSGPNANMGVALGGIIACGAVYAVIGLIVSGVGTRWIESPDAAGGDRRGGGGDRPEPGADRGQGVSAAASTAGWRWHHLVRGLRGGIHAGMLQRLLILIGLLLAYVLYAVLTNGMGLGKPIDFHRGQRRLVRPAALRSAGVQGSAMACWHRWPSSWWPRTWATSRRSRP